jgi:hypothetical protein
MGWHCLVKSRLATCSSSALVGTDLFGVKLEANCPLPLAAALDELVHLLLTREKELQRAHSLVLAGLVHAQQDIPDLASGSWSDAGTGQEPEAAPRAISNIHDQFYRFFGVVSSFG